LKFHAKVTITVAAALVFIASVMDAAHAVDLSQPVTLVAGDGLAGSVYEETVLIAAPLPRGQHVGFILNRPTRVKLGTIFPEHAASRRVTGPVSFGGPMFPEMIVALTRKVPPGAAATIPLMSGLVAVIDGKSVDRVIEKIPNEARYFVGLVIWAPGELDAEVRGGAWAVRPADASLVFSSNSARLWKELSSTGRWVEAIEQAPAMKPVSWMVRRASPATPRIRQ